MGRKNWLKRLERATSEDLASFVLKDGSHHYYHPAGGEQFLHAMRCVRANREGKPYPQPPQTIQALTRARDRAAALEQVVGDTFPYDRQALIERGELVPRSMEASEASDRRHREGDDLHGA
jgi:hypothetical protein